MLADNGLENGQQVEYPIDTDPQTQALEELFRNVLFDKEGKQLLVNKRNTVASIGPGAFAGHEQAALVKLFGLATRYIGVEPDSSMLQLSNEVKRVEGGPGDFDLRGMTAKELLEMIEAHNMNSKQPEQGFSGLPIDVLLARNPFGMNGPMSTIEGIHEMAQLAEHVNPGGLVMVTYSHVDSHIGHGGPEGERVAKLQELLAEQGFRTVRSGERPVSRQKVEESGLVFSDNGVLVMQRMLPKEPIVPVLPAPQR